MAAQQSAFLKYHPQHRITPATHTMQTQKRHHGAFTKHPRGTKALHSAPKAFKLRTKAFKKQKGLPARALSTMPLHSSAALELPGTQGDLIFMDHRKKEPPNSTVPKLRKPHLMLFFVCLFFVRPPVLKAAPRGEQNHGYAMVRHGLTCCSVQGVLQNNPRIPSRGMNKHQCMPCGHAFAVRHRHLSFASVIQYKFTSSSFI